jgi:hypothetical protein
MMLLCMWGFRLSARACLCLLCSLLATMTALALAAPASAQGDLLYFLDMVPAKIVPAAFEQPFGRALMTEFVSVMADSADPGCLKTKRITKDKVAERARPILLRRGTYLVRNLIGTIDKPTFRTYLRARLGADGVADFERLPNDPAVREYRAAEEPARLAYIATYILETMDRYATIQRIKLARGISPLNMTNQSILGADPTDKIKARLVEMVAADKSGVVARYAEMTTMAQKPLDDAMVEKMRNLGVGELLAGPDKDRQGFYNDLVALCVAPTTRR